MKLLSVVQARSVWIGQTGDLNPLGRSNPDMPTQLKQRYGFQIAPENFWLSLKQQQMAVFEHGTFTNKAGQRLQVSLVLGNGYAAADTRSSTTDCDEFLEDLFTWMTEVNGLANYKEIFKTKTYISNLQISLKKPLDTINPKLAKFMANFSKLIVGLGHHNFETAAIQFWPDTTMNPRPSPFRIERQEGTKPSENRFFSGAPLDTQAHLRLLEEFEELLA